MGQSPYTLFLMGNLNQPGGQLGGEQHKTIMAHLVLDKMGMGLDSEYIYQLSYI